MGGADGGKAEGGEKGGALVLRRKRGRRHGQGGASGYEREKKKGEL